MRSPPLHLPSPRGLERRPGLRSRPLSARCRPAATSGFNPPGRVRGGRSGCQQKAPGSPQPPPGARPDHPGCPGLSPYPQLGSRPRHPAREAFPVTGPGAAPDLIQQELLRPRASRHLTDVYGSRDIPSDRHRYPQFTDEETRT